MRAMMALAFGRCTCSSASERATTAMSAAMPHSTALSAFGAAYALLHTIAARSTANCRFMISPSRAARLRGPPWVSLLLLLGRVRLAIRRVGAARHGRAGRAGSAGSACAGLHGVELALRQAVVVVLIELGEAVRPRRVLRFVTRNVAVAVLVDAREAALGGSAGFGLRRIRRAVGGVAAAGERGAGAGGAARGATRGAAGAGRRARAAGCATGRRGGFRGALVGAGAEGARRRGGVAVLGLHRAARLLGKNHPVGFRRRLRREGQGKGAGHRDGNGCFEFHIVVSMRKVRWISWQRQTGDPHAISVP